MILYIYISLQKARNISLFNLVLLQSLINMTTFNSNPSHAGGEMKMLPNLESTVVSHDFYREVTQGHTDIQT